MKNRLVVARSQEWPARREGRESTTSYKGTARGTCGDKTVLFYYSSVIKLHRTIYIHTHKKVLVNLGNLNKPCGLYQWLFPSTIAMQDATIKGEWDIPVPLNL